MMSRHTYINTHTNAHTHTPTAGLSASEMNQIKYLLFSIQ